LGGVCFSWKEVEMSTAILIHGCHLKARGWEEIVWGDGSLNGRIPVGVQLACEKGADFVFWGTGASEANGCKESEWAYTLAQEHADELTLDMEQSDLQSYLEQVSFVDTETQNTAQEIRLALRMCAVHGIEELILVSSPTHIGRCMLEAQKLLYEYKIFRDICVMATASGTCYAGTKPHDVIEIEPPHRGDDPMIDAVYQMHEVVPRLFKLPPKEREEALKGLSLLLDEYGA
jgi:hypothetical protein